MKLQVSSATCVYTFNIELRQRPGSCRGTSQRAEYFIYSDYIAFFDCDYFFAIGFFLSAVPFPVLEQYLEKEAAGDREKRRREQLRDN